MRQTTNKRAAQSIHKESGSVSTAPRRAVYRARVELIYGTIAATRYLAKDGQVRALSRAPLRPTIGPIVLRAISVGPFVPHVPLPAPGPRRQYSARAVRERPPHRLCVARLLVRRELRTVRLLHGTPPILFWFAIFFFQYF